LLDKILGGRKVKFVERQNKKINMKKTNYFRVFWTSNGYSDYSTREEAVKFLATKLPAILKTVRVKFEGKNVTDSERLKIIAEAIKQISN
jgi:hypothetical protein